MVAPASGLAEPAHLPIIKQPSGQMPDYQIYMHLHFGKHLKVVRDRIFIKIYIPAEPPRLLYPPKPDKDSIRIFAVSRKGARGLE